MTPEALRTTLTINHSVFIHLPSRFFCIDLSSRESISRENGSLDDLLCPVQEIAPEHTRRSQSWDDDKPERN